MESLVIEFNQEKFKEFLSSSSASPKAMWLYLKISSETRSRISSEILPKWPALLLTTQVVPLLTRFWKPLVQPIQPALTSLRRPAGLMRRYTITMTMKINPAITLLSKLCKSNLLRVPKLNWNAERRRRCRAHWQQIKNSIEIICSTDYECEAHNRVSLKWCEDYVSISERESRILQQCEVRV